MPLTPIADESLAAIRPWQCAGEAEVLAALIGDAGIDTEQRRRITAWAVKLIERIRSAGQPGVMELFLAEYGLSTNEGIALMCLAEALLRVPDPDTIDALIDDKITPYDWDEHIGHSGSGVVNASTLGLMLTGRILDDDNTASVAGLFNRTVKRLGEPVVRVAVTRAMREMGNQFVLGQTISQALERSQDGIARGYRYSYDMLGEAALTRADAEAYFEAYADAIGTIGRAASGGLPADRPGISVKLSALHPRFEYAQTRRLSRELAPRLNALARLAQQHNMGLNVDAEEASRLEPLLQVVRIALSDTRLADWEGFGLVVQAYGKRSGPIIDWFHSLATNLNRRVMLRLVKGAYWDTEIKQAQVDGASDYPVFTRRAATDISYICCAARLLRMTDRIYPQFATHNAQTAAAILELAGSGQRYEFQRLHGMGETLHNHLLEHEGVRCRIYAPVGPHKDLLAYLVRRLLENGANSSFVNQIVDADISAAELAADPFDALAAIQAGPPAAIKAPAELYAPKRIAARGWDLQNSSVVAEIDLLREPLADRLWQAEPALALAAQGGRRRQIFNPADPAQPVGTVVEATASDCVRAAQSAGSWQHVEAVDRAGILRRAADMYEAGAGEMLALLTREAGKTAADAVAELREAVDFLRYYAGQGLILADRPAIGLVACISPWNFPLAIFTGQIAAALAAGNAVVAKPAEATALTAAAAVRVMHAAGVPRDVLQLLPGDGDIGQTMVSQPQVQAVCFTGSIATAQNIHRTLAQRLPADAPLIAETGGINAAIVDSTALPEAAVRDTLASAFHSAGQRCSALRVLYLQQEIADGFLEMLCGAMDELTLGDPWQLDVDVGPVISAQAQQAIQAYIDSAESRGRLRKQLVVPDRGHFVGPAVIEVLGIEEVDREIFGPVLHVVRYASEDFDAVLDAINRHGYGLTFGLHTRIDERAKAISDRLQVGNIYVNRNQIGAVVESQPFGGEGLSGTGPKAGGPQYLLRFKKTHGPRTTVRAIPALARETVQSALDSITTTAGTMLASADMPGPTGESNRLALWPRGTVLCLGPTPAQADAQAATVQRSGCRALIALPGAAGPNCLDGFVDRADLQWLQGFDVVALWSDEDDLRAARQALAARSGKLLPLAAGDDLGAYCIVERHTCIDTTAAGGNASLLASVSS